MMNRPDGLPSHPLASPSGPAPLLPDLNPRLRRDLGLADERPAPRPVYLLLRGEYGSAWW